MRVSFEARQITCHATKKAGRPDAVQVMFAGASDMGQADRMESDISTITDQLERGPYELTANDELDLLTLLPIGRAAWRLEPLEFTESSNIVFTLAGVGLHKVELSGSNYNDLSGVQKLAMDLYIKVFKAIMSKLSPVGGAIVMVMDFVQSVAATGKNEHCLGALFIFKKQYSGADLAFNLLKASGQTLRFELTQADSEPFEVADSCRQPSYSTSMVLRLHDKIDFSLETETVPRFKGPPMTVIGLLEQCKTSDTVQIWTVKQDTIYRYTPTVEFGELKYVWSVNGQPLSTTDSQITLSLPVTRYVEGALYETTTATETVILNYDVDSRGPLRITCPSTSGNFRISVACEIHNSKGEKHPVYGTRWLDVESEVIDGNAAYHTYQECVRGFWNSVKRKFEEFNEHLKTIPAAVPHFDGAPGRNQMTKVLDQVQKLVAEVKQMTKQIPRIR